MSLILFMETNEGLIITGDSRLSRTDDSNWHNDNAQKIFEFNKEIVIAYHDQADINGKSIEEIINNFISSVNEIDTIKQVSEKMKKYITQRGCPKTTFYLFGYENQERKFYKFNLAENLDENLSTSTHGCGGRDEIAWNMLKGNFEAHETNEKAIELINKIYTKTKSEIDSVGGPIDILLVSPNNGISWIQHK